MPRLTFGDTSGQAMCVFIIRAIHMLRRLLSRLTRTLRVAAWVRRHQRIAMARQTMGWCM